MDTCLPNNEREAEKFLQMYRNTGGQTYINKPLVFEFPDGLRKGEKCVFYINNKLFLHVFLIVECYDSNNQIVGYSYKELAERSKDGALVYKQAHRSPLAYEALDPEWKECVDHNRKIGKIMKAKSSLY